MNSENPKNSLPLISVCATFFNAERYIHRLIESCIHQTYSNWELILIDDQSADRSGEIIYKYSKKDPRIKYFLNPERVGLTESEVKMFEHAIGKFSVMVGADDWIAKDFIENGVLTFSQNPDTAGIIPRLISLRENSDGTFTMIDDTFFGFAPPLKKTAEWFAKNIYRPKHLYISALALVRAEDYKRAMTFYAENYYRNLPENAPKETRHLMKMAFGMDIVVFLHILSGRKNFVFDSSLRYFKVGLPEGQANNLNFAKESLPAVISELRHNLSVFEPIYEKKWHQNLKRMRVFKGAEMISFSLITVMRRKLSSSFIKKEDAVSAVKIFFRNFKKSEIIKSFIVSVPMTLNRFLFSLIRPPKPFNKDWVFEDKNFLNKNRRFTAN